LSVNPEALSKQLREAIEKAAPKERDTQSLLQQEGLTR
jgi:hypothetical protein